MHFFSNEGYDIDSISLKAGTKLKELPQAEKENNVFEGWFLDKEFTKPFTSNYMPYADVILFAKWTEIEQEIIQQVVISVVQEEEEFEPVQMVAADVVDDEEEGESDASLAYLINEEEFLTLSESEQ